MKIGIPGTTKNFQNRTGGYLNYQYNSQNPENNNPGFMLDEEESDHMLDAANVFIESYFPWMKDFILLQLRDGTIRLDVADRQFLQE